MSGFHVGQRVVCVDADWHDNAIGFDDVPCPLEKGHVYTVMKIGHTDIPHVFRGSSGHVCIWLAEVANPYKDAGFAAVRFRPLDESRLDIFRAMLVSPPKVQA